MMNSMKAVLGAAFALSLVAGMAEAADADAGKKVFNRCKACHKLEAGKNGVGPSLAGIVGRPVATVDGFKYSDAMTAWGEGKAWTAENLAEFLASPKKTVKGTKMAFAGLRKPEQIENVIAYLEAAK